MQSFHSLNASTWLLSAFSAGIPTFRTRAGSISSNGTLSYAIRTSPTWVPVLVETQSHGEAGVKFPESFKETAELILTEQLAGEAIGITTATVPYTVSQVSTGGQ